MHQFRFNLIQSTVNQSTKTGPKQNIPGGFTKQMHSLLGPYSHILLKFLIMGLLSSCLSCLRASKLYLPACLRAYVPTCFTFHRALMH